MKNKTFKSAILIAFVGAFFISCDKEDVNTFNGPTTDYFSPTSYAINAVDDTSTTTNIEIVSTSVSSTDRTYNLDLDASSTAVLGTDFTLATGTITIPAGSYSGTTEVTSVLTEDTYSGVTAIFNLTGSDNISVYNNVATVNISHSTCAVDAALYTGDYTLEQTAGDNTFGDAFTATTVTLSNSGGTIRSFDSVYLLDAGQGPMTFNFDLNCGTVIPEDEQNTGLSCGATITLSSVDGSNTSYSPFDDSELFITFSENIDGCAVAEATVTTIKLTKI